MKGSRNIGIGGGLFLAALLLCWIGSGNTASAQNAEAYTNGAGPARVLLIWSPDTATSPPVRYNVYRKNAGAPTYPGTPLNPTPIAQITDCAAFKTRIPEGSELWNMLSYSLGDSTGGTPPTAPLADVCSIVSFPVGSEKWRRTQIFAGFRPEVAEVLGQAWTDNTVTGGTAYTYRIVRVNAGGTELPVPPEAEVTITAGTPGAIPAPSDVTAIAGDARVQVLWTPPVPEFQAFSLYRATAPGGPFTKVSDVDYSILISTDINEDTVLPAGHGFTDYEHYDDTTGVPIFHPVPNDAGVNVSVTGPANGVTYYYRLRHKDPLGNLGPVSTTVSATPADSTRPSVPQGLSVTAVEPSSGFQVRWRKVMVDIDGRLEGVRGYRVFRYEQAEDPNSGATPVGGIVSQPTDSTTYITIIDSSGGLRSDCGDKTYFYRVQTLDSAGLTSFHSIAVGDALKDTTRPDNVKGTTAEGFPDLIRVRWDPNSDCDIERYLVYRALCNRGSWLPCPDMVDTTNREAFMRWLAIYYDRTGQKPPTYDDDNYNATHYRKPVLPKLPDCGGPFELIGTVTKEEADAMVEAEGKVYYDDRSVPTESPICYAYLVKAQDRSQNISGELPIPDPINEIVVCQRIRDKTPPEPAVVSGLLARDSAIIVEYIGPPVQDIAAYHVYRAEKEDDTYTWVGGTTVVAPPGVGVQLTAPYTPPAVVECDSIPLVSREYMSLGRFVDTAVERHRIYWYKVVGIDQQGNEISTDSAIALSTFTFASNREAPPEISTVTPEEGPCALTVSWTPVFDPAEFVGFVLFRSRLKDGPYQQVESVVQGNSFMDNSVARNVTYWYRVCMIRKDGTLSKLSEPKKGLHP